MRTALLIFVALLVAGCNRQEESKEAVELGDKRVKLGAFREAVRAYESALDGTAKTADIHYKMGVLFDDKLKSPLAAIYHYDRYLEMAPAGAHTKDVKTARADCEKRLSLSLKEGGFVTPAEAARLRNENEGLRKTIAEMRNPKPPAAPRVPDPSVPDKLPPGSRKHVVERGETLASIAFRYYRNRAQASLIRDANFNQLGGKDVIKPGMTLIIPEPKSKKKPKP